MTDLEDACRAFIAGELSPDGFSARLHAEESPRATPYLTLLTEYENSDWNEAELRARVADRFTDDRHK